MVGTFNPFWHLYFTIACFRGNVRLVGGNFTEEGTVEVCNDNMWGRVCDTLWNASNARVVCNQLGYTSGKHYISGP